jgi:hypothetical protein
MVGGWARASLVVVELDSYKPHVYRRPIDIRLNSELQLPLIDAVACAYPSSYIFLNPTRHHVPLW